MNKLSFKDKQFIKYDPEHLDMLNQGAVVWNQWRADNPEVRPRLVAADLDNADFSGYDLRNADISDWHHSTNLRDSNLSGALLDGAELQAAILLGTNLNGVCARRANFRRATCRNATFVDAVLTGAQFQESELTGTDFRGANLEGAWLQRAALYSTYLQGANLNACYVAGVSTWDVVLDKHTQQAALNISREFSDDLHQENPGEAITVDDIEVANFVHMILENKKLRNLIDGGQTKLCSSWAVFRPRIARRYWTNFGSNFVNTISCR